MSYSTYKNHINNSIQINLSRQEKDRSSSLGNKGRQGMPSDLRSLITLDRHQQQKTTQLQMNFIFESLYQNNSDLPDEILENKNGQPVSVSVQAGQIKMMDTILFDGGFQPKKWIFTDLLGRIQFKDINSITINDVIRAFLVNLNENKKNEFNNEDLIEFLSNSSNRSKICFAIVGNQRHFLDIGALSDLKNKFPKGIDALQLYKIPTRDFLPYFYYHTLQFKPNGLMSHHMIVRVSHFVKDLGAQTQRNSEFYEEKIPDEEYEFFAFQMLEVSKQLIYRIQERNPTMTVKSIKIAYLIEQSNFDPWFIGTEHCHIHLNQQIDHYSNRQQVSRVGGVSKKNFVKKLHDDINQSRVNTQMPDYTGFPQENSQNPNESIYALSSNEYVTQTELLKGLQQIGQKFGKDQQVEVKIKRPKTMQVLTEEKSRRMLRYQEQIQDQRNKLKEKSKRIVELFPKYLEKTGSKTHAQFLFGNVSSDRLFRDYQRLRFQKQQHQEVELLKQESHRNAAMQNHMSGSSFYRRTGNKSIFNVQMSAETQYLDNSAISDMPYQDAYLYDRQSTRMINQTNITEMNENLILNQDISMFQQNNNQSALGHTADHLSLKDSVLSFKDDDKTDQNQISTIELGDKVNVTEANKTQNEYLNQSIRESKMVEEPSLQLAQNDLEKDLIALMLMNKDLDNLVVIDKKKAVNNIRQKIQFDQTRIQQLGASLQNESDQVFTNRRRKLDQEELNVYYQWKQMMLDQQQNQLNLNGQTENFHQPDIKQVFPIQKRSKTSSGIRKNGKMNKIKQTALSLLQIKGSEAKVQNVSRAEVLKQHIATSKEQAQMLQKSYEEKRDTEQNQKRKHLGSKKNSINQASQINFPKEPTKIQVKTQSLNLDDKSQQKALFLRIMQGIQKV